MNLTKEEYKEKMKSIKLVRGWRNIIVQKHMSHLSGMELSKEIEVLTNVRHGHSYKTGIEKGYIQEILLLEVKQSKPKDPETKSQKPKFTDIKFNES